jgi:hypothetical protein
VYTGIREESMGVRPFVTSNECPSHTLAQGLEAVRVGFADGYQGAPKGTVLYMLEHPVDKSEWRALD